MLLKNAKIIITEKVLIFVSIIKCLNYGYLFTAISRAQ